MYIREVDSTNVPMELMLIADPSKEIISSYINDSLCFCAFEESSIIGVAVVQLVSKESAEIFNISVLPEFQKTGIGTQLLQTSLVSMKEQGVERVVLGTGTFGYQLTFYQRNDFRVDSVLKNYFLESYSEPLEENGIQHKDMLRLYVDL